MDKDSTKVTEEAWLICPNWTEVRRFTKNKNNEDKFFEYMFVDSGIVVGVLAVSYTHLTLPTIYSV